MTTPTEWCWDPMPTVDGWFAVIRCYEPQEGMFPAVVWATAGKVAWPHKTGMASDGRGHAGPFVNKAEAQAWADAHDPEGL